MPKLLTIKEVASKLGVKPCTIRAWLAVRKLTFVRCGRAIRIPVTSIERFVQENTISALEEECQ